ncbi:hypothetical protein MMC25_002157 [Agyrium rufum]|nr:hypothetical protein [Agyrium rufum]
MSWSSVLWAICNPGLPIGLTLCTIYLIASAIYNLFFSPLAKHPGPFFSKISAIPSFYHAVKGDRHIWVWQCFQTYGSKFRVYSNGILFLSPNAFHDIYSMKANVEKSKGYRAWKRSEEDINTLTEVDHVDRWNDLLIEGDGRDWSSPLNINDSCNGLTLDLLGDLCFGRSFDIKEPDDQTFDSIPESIRSYMKFSYPMSKFPSLDFLLWVKPRGLNQFLEMITPKDVRKWMTFVEESVASRIQLEKDMQSKSIEQDKNGDNNHDGSIRRDMFHYLFQAKDPETDQAAFSERDLMAEANLLLVAGSDSTSMTFCSLIFYLVRDSTVYANLVAEIRSTFSTIDDIVSGPRLSGCHYMRACGLHVDGDFLPEGVDVAISAWSSNRNEETYGGDAAVFRPERWIVDADTDADIGNQTGDQHASQEEKEKKTKKKTTAEDVARIRNAFHPFSSGPDTCVGKNLAIMELMLLVARTLFRLDVRLVPGSTMGEGKPEYGWGKDDPRQYMVEDAFIPIRHGPMVQFRRARS